jgi:phosphoserine phosphatase
VDSTVSTEEGIDVLAEACGKGREVAEWTARAMNGQVLFQDAIRARLELIQPTRQDIERLWDEHDFPLTEGMPELFARLRALRKEVVLVSGGLVPMIRPLAERLHVDPTSHLYAIDLHFDEQGRFVDFTREAPTAATGGKQRVVELLRQQHGSVVMIGDGATDMEARPSAQAVIGFGGNVVRPTVLAQADWFVHSTQELLDVLADAEVHPPE